MRLGLPLKSIDPEHISSPRSRQVANMAKHEPLSDRSHYFSMKENNPNVSNYSGRFM